MEKIREEYAILSAVCDLGKKNLYTAYQQLCNLLERICKENIEDSSLQMTDMAARISFISAKLKLTMAEQNKLHTVRIVSNYVLNHRIEPGLKDLLRDVKTVARLVERLYAEQIPVDLLALLPEKDVFPPIGRKEQKHILYMRVCYQRQDENFLYVIRLDESEEEELKVHYRTSELEEDFKDTCKVLWPHAQLNLLDVDVQEDKTLMPDFIVLEPDYLFNISSLAECYKDYGAHPANYLLSRLALPANTRALLLGNITNLFLDEWINNDEVSYQDAMKKAFRNYPLEIFSCEELKNPEEEKAFFRDCKMHFEHIRQIVTGTFKELGYDLKKEDAVVEPAYFCEALGLQGRLDYMQRDMSAFIEMKSGKADEFTVPGMIIPRENNLTQMLLYQAILQYSMGQDHRHVRPYLLYTRYPLLYPARPLWKKVKQIINLRNRIVANEYETQHHRDMDFTASLLQQISPEVLNEKKLRGKYWDLLKRDIDTFQHLFSLLTELEKRYFYSVYHFITTELYTSKSGDGDAHYEGKRGASALWLNTIEEKNESGEILYDLQLEKNDGERLTFRISEIPLLPNFRNGDVVALYLRDEETDNVTNRQVLKGSIESIDGERLVVVLRNPQRIFEKLPRNSRYAIEHDVMDAAFTAMYHGLAGFLNANKERRDLLLTERLPQSEWSAETDVDDDFKRVSRKALMAKDYFLLMGPPGSGKTSHALKQMVTDFLKSSEDSLILLMAYTNRAVDEICKALSSIEGKPDFLRIGNEMSCEETYRSHLLSNRMGAFSNRKEAMTALNKIRVFVGTIISLSDKDALFKLKHFDMAIIDEASQVLEPQLLNLLCARNVNGNNAIGKFVMIGDYKQLPAVVMQRKEQSKIDDDLLLAQGFRNLNESLFERLYRCLMHASGDVQGSYDILLRQGRMNPAVATFSNEAFYRGALVSAGLPHQCDSLELSPSLPKDQFAELMLQRVAFIPSKAEPWEHSAKMNRMEAEICARIAENVYEQYSSDFNADVTLGIITPYRSQIVVIKRAIAALNVESLNKITVDTVERFQGSERDVIIYSFCVNHTYQLDFLSNLTEEDGVPIDRKLNVALTRARRQMFLTGVPELLALNPIYKRLLKQIPFKEIM
jgi:hypothetical protein